MKNLTFSGSVTFRWKQVLIFILCVISFASNIFAETTLIIATGELPPITSKQPEKSFLTEIFLAVEKEMGVTFVFKFLSWKRCEMYAENLMVWGTIPYVRTTKREQKFHFSQPIYKSSTKLFGYTSDGKIKNISYTKLSDLKSYRIGGLRGYWYEKPFLDAGIKLEFVANNGLNIEKLRAGRLDLVPLGETSGWYTINTLFAQDKGKFFALEPPLFVKENCLMTSKRYPDGQELLTKFNTALEKIKKNGVFQNIIDKHKAVIFAY